MRSEKRFGSACFLPWIGARYKTGIAGGLKLLILGESHYHDPRLCTRHTEGECVWCAAARDGSFTKLAVERLALEREHRFFKTIRRFFEQIDDGEASQIAGEFWPHVSFYNYVQFLMDGPRQTLSSIRRLAPEHDASLVQVLRELRPDRVLVLGKANWLGLPCVRRTENVPVLECMADERLPLARAMGRLPQRAAQCVWIRGGAGQTWSLTGAVKHPGYGLTMSEWQGWVREFMSAEHGPPVALRRAKK